METEKRKFAKKDDPKAVEYLIKGRDALVKKDYSAAMRNFKKCDKCKITKELRVLLLEQMANCMDQLKYFDQQQTFLEELVELELNYDYAKQLMNIYQYTNNEVKMKKLNEKIRTLEPKDEEERKLSIQLLTWGKDYTAAYPFTPTKR